MRPDSDRIDMAPLPIVEGLLTVALLVIAGLGVAHNVVLNTRDRRSTS